MDDFGRLLRLLGGARHRRRRHDRQRRATATDAKSPRHLMCLLMITADTRIAVNGQRRVRERGGKRRQPRQLQRAHRGVVERDEAAGLLDLRAWIVPFRRIVNFIVVEPTTPWF